MRLPVSEGTRFNLPFPTHKAPHRSYSPNIISVPVLHILPFTSWIRFFTVSSNYQGRTWANRCACTHTPNFQSFLHCPVFIESLLCTRHHVWCSACRWDPSVKDPASWRFRSRAGVSPCQPYCYLGLGNAFLGEADDTVVGSLTAALASPCKTPAALSFPSVRNKNVSRYCLG